MVAPNLGGMSWERAALAGLRAHDVDVVAYIPDSVLADLVDLVEAADDVTAVRVSREEEGAAVLSGAWLGGRRGALVCQSSGLANTFNALGSHLKPAGVPFVGLVTRRGGLGDHNYAQVPAGYNMPRLLDDMGVRNHGLDDGSDVERVVEMAAETAFSTNDPYVLLLEPTLTGGKSS